MEETQEVKTNETKQKAVILVAILILLIIAITTGIMAYFTSIKTATNVFTIGNVRINLTEGQVWDDAIANNTIPEIAQNIQPGQSIAKTPVVENVGSNPAYVYAKVYVPVNGTDDLFTYTINNGWTKRAEELHTTDDQYNIYVYEYNQTLQPNGETPALFDAVVFANGMDFTPEQAANLGTNNQLNVIVKAYAIQAEGGVTKATNEMTTQMTTETGEATGLVGASVDPATIEGTVAYQAANDQISRWDPVDYETLNQSIGNANLNIAGATLSGTINANEADNWVVLDVTEDNEVLIIPTTYSSETLELEGMNGYNNGVSALNQISQVYLNPSLATSARSIKVDDVNAIEGMVTGLTASYNTMVTNEENTYSWENQYGMNSSTADIVDYGEGHEEERTYTVTEETQSYRYDLIKSSSYISDCWLASRFVYLTSTDCCFGLRYVNYGNVYGGYFECWFYVDCGGSSGGGSGGSYSVLPVVTLKSDIQMHQENGVWVFGE